MGPARIEGAAAPADLAPALAQIIADAVARNSTATAADLIVQSLMQGAASTLATGTPAAFSPTALEERRQPPVEESVVRPAPVVAVDELTQMVTEVGCKPPLSTALAMASTALAAEGRSTLIPDSLRSIDGVDVAPLAVCWLHPPAGGVPSKDAAGR